MKAKSDTMVGGALILAFMFSGLLVVVKGTALAVEAWGDAALFWIGLAIIIIGAAAMLLALASGVEL